MDGDYKARTEIVKVEGDLVGFVTETIHHHSNLNVAVHWLKAC